jgi:hypothetical protein
LAFRRPAAARNALSKTDRKPLVRRGFWDRWNRTPL